MLYVIAAIGLLIMIQQIGYMREHPHLRRMSFRNIWSQRKRSVYALIGGIMSTALIAAALQFQFSMERSADDYMKERFGPINAEISAERNQVSGFTEKDLERLSGDIEEAKFYEGYISTIMGEVTVYKQNDSGHPLRIQPKTMLYAFPDWGIKAASEDKSIQTYIKQASELSPLQGEIWLDSRTAEKLDAAPGQDVMLSARGRETTLKVAKVVEAKGLLAYPGEEKTVASVVIHDETAAQVLNIPDGTVNRVLLLPNTDYTSINNYSAYFINDDWNIRYTAMSAMDRLQGATKLLPIFTISSLTSIFIGMLFIINLFQMMTEERRQEIGILRAIGMNSSQVRGLLLLEGFWYALISGLLGLVVGVLLANILVSQIGPVLSQVMMSEEGLSVHFEPHPDLLRLLAAFCLGMILIMISILQVSGKPLKISIVESLIPALAEKHHTVRQHKAIRWISGGAVFAVMIGTIIYTATDDFLKSISFPAVDPFGIIMVCFFILGLAAVSAVLLLPLILNTLYAILAPLGKWRGVLKISLRYPLYYKRRTVLHLLMFSCVLFLTCFSAVFGLMVDNRFGLVNPREATGGFDRYAVTSEVITHEMLSEKRESSAKDILEGMQYVIVPTKELPFGYKQSVYGISEDYGKMQNMTLKQRALGIENDLEAWNTVVSDPEWIIVSDSFLRTIGLSHLSAGDMLIPDAERLRYSPGEENSKPFEIRKRIAAITEVHPNAVNNLTAQGIWMSSEAFAEEYADQSVSSLLLFKEAESGGTKADWEPLKSELSAMNIYPLIDPQELGEQGSGYLRVFFGLFEGFNALAVFIGTTGLLIIMLRSFAERRQQFGMLRAIGMTGAQIRHGFTLEGMVIAVLGITIGAIMGAYSGYLMSQAFLQDGIEELKRGTVELPWNKFLLYYVGATLLTLFSTSMPARKAQQLSPAEAFRYME
ncbi:ABC transporter permease [Paenibacillus dakarensis]|uniref:ABC transporter permease n=1 Tax=Paenibacillus dakarensis TaxID=1527293 RepID=UPI0006D565D6|nr:FtsX-like permease family protein [Paenibacillus dakarensis]